MLSLLYCCNTIYVYVLYQYKGEILELNEHEKIIGLKRLFVPEDKEYRRESVFESNEVF